MGCAASTAAADFSVTCDLTDASSTGTRRSSPTMGRAASTAAAVPSLVNVLTEAGAGIGTGFGTDGGHAGAGAGSNAFKRSVVPIELYSRIATFHCVTDDSTVMNMCLAAGPGQSAAFRRSYLADNSHYLLNKYGTTPQGIRLIANTRAWMTANPGWMQFIEPKLIEKHRRTESLSEDEAATAQADISVLSVLNNPALAIMMGATEILQYQVEELNIDMNGCWSILDHTTPQNLLTLSMVFDDYPSFQYLLQVDTVDVNALCMPLSAEGSATNIVASAILCHHWSNRETFIQALVQYPSLDVNSFCLGQEGVVELLPLQCALLALESQGYKSDGFHRLVRIIRTLLIANADPHLPSVGVGSSIQYARILARKKRSYRKKYKAVIKILEG